MRRCVSPARLLVAALLLVFFSTFYSACQYGVTSPVAPTTDPGSTVTSPGSTPLTYTANIAPIMASDCVRCHGPSRRDVGIDLSTYAGVMRTVVPGNPSSLLILVTQPGGVMYGQFRGSASQKATIIRDWIVSSNAAQ